MTTATAVRDRALEGIIFTQDHAPEIATDDGPFPYYAECNCGWVSDHYRTEAPALSIALTHVS